MTREETIKRIAVLADAFASQAGVGGCETAGAAISYLAIHPEKIDLFFSKGVLALLDDIGDASDMHAQGCLTFHRKDGKVTSPQDLRIARTVRDLARPHKGGG